MTNFEKSVDEATKGEKAQILGVVASAIDRDGKPLLSCSSGRTSLSPEAEAIDGDSILTLASCTKLMTSIAVLRLVQDDKISLDDSSIVEKHLPELYELEVLTSAVGEDTELEKRKNPITLRQLLTHSSGSSYDALDPRLMAWRKQRGEPPLAFIATLPTAITTPSVFQPGEGWAYGGSLDWVGLLTERVSGRSLGDLMRTDIFDRVGCDDRVGFARKELQEKEGGIVQTVITGEEGLLLDYPWPPAEQKSDRGGGGLYCSASNFVKILADLISSSPTLLNEDMLNIFFSPQFSEGSKPLEALRQASPVFTAMTGALTSSLSTSAINHALGGLLITEDNPDLGRTAGTMAWGGAFNCLWFANRSAGVAGFYGSSMFPPGGGKSGELMGIFLKEAWRKTEKTMGES